MKPRLSLRRIAIAVGSALAIWAGLGALTAYVSMQPAPQAIAKRARIGDRPVLDVEVRATDGVRTVAWFVDGGGDRCAVLLSGIHGSRLASLPRASFWLERGWSVLLPDLRGTGESDPRPISFGWNERLDVEVWVRLLRERRVRTIALHGQSLGAAAAVYAAAEGTGVELLVLDACYDTAKAALERRLPYVPWPSLAFLPVRFFIGLRVGASPKLMSPVECLTRIRVPTFLAVGSEDQEVGRTAPEEMLRACAAQKKTLHWVEGARHEELWLRDPAGLAHALGAFIDEIAIE